MEIWFGDSVTISGVGWSLFALVLLLICTCVCPSSDCISTFPLLVVVQFPFIQTVDLLPPPVVVHLPLIQVVFCPLLVLETLVVESAWATEVRKSKKGIVIKEKKRDITFCIKLL